MKRLTAIWSPRKFIVVCAQYDGAICSLKAGKVNDKGEVLTPFTSFAEVSELVKHFGKEHPYWLHTEGTGVLTRLVEADTDYRRDLILNADPESFYFSTFRKGAKEMVSFARTTVSQALVEALQEHKVYLLGVSCGFTPYTALMGEEGTLDLEYRMEVRKGQVVQLERSKEVPSRIVYEDRYRDVNELLVLALVKGGLFLQDRNAQESVLRAHDFPTRQTEYKEYRKFKVFGIAAVSLILVLLVGNYFYLNVLNQEVADKEAELALSNSNLSILNQLEQEEIRKQQLVLSSGVSSNHFISYYLDEIGKGVPKEIRLSEMYVFPLKEKLKDKRKVEVDQKKIEISGWTSDNVVLDDWIEDMDKAAWVGSVELLNYQKMANNDAGFKLIILLAE